MVRQPVAKEDKIMRKMTNNEMTNINGGATKECCFCGRRFTGWFSNLKFIVHFYSCARRQ